MNHAFEELTGLETVSGTSWLSCIAQENRALLQQALKMVGDSRQELDLTVEIATVADGYAPATCLIRRDHKKNGRNGGIWFISFIINRYTTSSDHQIETVLTSKIHSKSSDGITVDAKVADGKMSEKLSSAKRYDTQYSLAKIVQTSSDAIISYSTTGEILSWNSGAEGLYGYSPEEVVGKSFSMLVPEDRQEELKEIVSAISTGQTIDTFETVRIAKGGEPVHVSLQIAPLRDDSGIVFGGFAIARNITRRREAESTLLSQAEQLAKANADLERFAWMAAHDLKEPIRTMTTYAHLIAEELDEEKKEELKDMLDFMIDAGSRAAQRIQDVLTYSSVGKKDFAMEEMDLTLIVERVVADLKQTISETNAIFHIEQLPKARINLPTITLLFQNLISNALKFCPSRQPEISISCEVRETDYVISVQDNGIGIDKESTKKIFDMFQRLEPNRFPGTGIGLAICRKVVESHNGILWVDSKESEGSTFRFSLPKN